MTRTKSFNENQALEAAMYQFWKKGYADTSIQNLECAMNLKRTSIYNAFGNKRKLFQRALTYYLETVLVRFVTVLQEAVTARHAIENVLNEVIILHYNPNNPGGCMVVLSLLENQQHDDETNIILNNALRQLRDAVVSSLKRGKKNGEFKNTIQYQNIANQVVALITGVIVLAKASFSEKELKKLNATAVEGLFFSITKTQERNNG